MRQFRPLDLLSLRTVIDAAIAPGGEEFTYAVREPSGASALWRGFEQAGDPSPLTRGPRDRFPRYSPDGRQIAFLRGDADAAQIYLLDRRGGEAMPFTRLFYGVREFAWSVDGRAIAAVVPVGPDGPRPLAADEETRRAPAAATDALILVQMDGTWRQLSADGLDCAHPTFAPNGGVVAFLARQPGEPPCLAVVPTDGGLAQRVVEPEYAPGPAAFSPDGSRLAFAARPPGAVSPALYTAHVTGGRPEPYVEGPADALPPAPDVAPVYSIDGSSVYTLVGAQGAWRLAEVQPRQNQRPRSPHGISVVGFALDDAGNRAALVVEEQVGPARFELRDPACRLLLRSHHEDPGLAGVRRVAPHTIPLQDGTSAHLYLPLLASSAPCVLLASRSGHSFSAQAQTLASGGFAVITAPPGHLEAALQAALVAFPQLDAGRLGICAEGDDAALDWPLLRGARAAAFTNPPQGLPADLPRGTHGCEQPAVLLLFGADVDRRRVAFGSGPSELVSEHVFAESGPVSAWQPTAQTTRLTLEAEWFSRYLAQ